MLRSPTKMLTTNLQPNNHIRLMIHSKILIGVTWAKMIFKDNKKLHMVRCNGFRTMDMKKIVIQPK